MFQMDSSDSGFRLVSNASRQGCIVGIHRRLLFSLADSIKASYIEIYSSVDRFSGATAKFFSTRDDSTFQPGIHIFPTMPFSGALDMDSLCSDQIEIRKALCPWL